MILNEMQNISKENAKYGKSYFGNRGPMNIQRVKVVIQLCQFCKQIKSRVMFAICTGGRSYIIILTWSYSIDIKLQLYILESGSKTTSRKFLRNDVGGKQTLAFWLSRYGDCKNSLLARYSMEFRPVRVKQIKVCKKHRFENYRPIIHTVTSISVQLYRSLRWMQNPKASLGRSWMPHKANQTKLYQGLQYTQIAKKT